MYFLTHSHWNQHPYESVVMCDRKSCKVSSVLDELLGYEKCLLSVNKRGKKEACCSLVQLFEMLSKVKLYRPLPSSPFRKTYSICFNEAAGNCKEHGSRGYDISSSRCSLATSSRVQGVLIKFYQHKRIFCRVAALGRLPFSLAYLKVASPLSLVTKQNNSTRPPSSSIATQINLVTPIHTPVPAPPLQQIHILQLSSSSTLGCGQLHQACLSRGSFTRSSPTPFTYTPAATLDGSFSIDIISCLHQL